MICGQFRLPAQAPARCVGGTCAVAFLWFYRGLGDNSSIVVECRNDPLVMVFASFVNRDHCRFEIRPNRSLDWRTTKFFYLALVCVSMGIAGGFAAMGFWPILPFAGAELAALGLAFYVCALRGTQREIVVIDDNTVAVEAGTTSLECTWKFARAWTKVILSRPRVRWYPSRLLLRSHGCEVEVGEFLNEQERRRLAGDLRRVINTGAQLVDAGRLATDPRLLES